MRLAYFHYGLGEARIIAYHKEILDIHASIEGMDGSAPFQTFAPIFHVSPPVGTRTLRLEASKNGEILGTCQCQFNKGMHATEATGIFAEMPAPVPLINKETVTSHKRKNLVETLPPTDIIPLSQVFDSWDSNKEFSISVRDDQGTKNRVTGYSAVKDSVAGIRTALVMILSGQESGRIEFALWSREDGGLQLGGREGIGTPWKFYESIEVFPKKVKAIIGLPPQIVMQKAKQSEQIEDCSMQAARI